MEICTAAEITKPTLYYHFSSKEGLYETVWQEKFTLLQGPLIEFATYVPRPSEYEQDVLPVLVAVIGAYRNVAKADPAFFRMLASLLFAPDEASSTLQTSRYLDLQRTILESMFTGMAAVHGNLRGKEQLLAASFLGTIFSCISLDSSGHYGAELIARQFMHGIFS